jgi:hypothetical protein
MRNLGVSRRRHGLELELWTTRSTLSDLVVELHQGHRRITTKHVAQLAQPPHQFVLRVNGHPPAGGRYTVIVRHARRVLLRRGIRVR